MKNLFAYLVVLMFIGIALLIWDNPIGAWIFVPSMTLSVIFIALNEEK
jgi:hypothetical protein